MNDRTMMDWMNELLRALSELDADVLLFINGMHNGYFDNFMYAFSGKLVWVPLYVSLVYLIFRNLRWQAALGCAVAIALTIVFADQVGASLIRPEVCRLRPSNPDNPLSEWIHLVNGYRGGRYGFPSCHAANTFGLAFFIYFLFRNQALTYLVMLWALLTCYSRAYLGVHYPGDLLAGALLGLCGAALMYGLFRWLVGYRRPQHFKDLWVPMVTGGLTVAGMLVYAAF